MEYIYFLLGIIILFIIYVEFNVGSILFRYDSLNQISMNIPSMLNYMIHPLTNSFLWNVNSLDINYIFVIGISSLLYRLIS